MVLVKQPYTLNDVKKDLEKIQTTITHIDNEFYSEIYTIRTQGEAKLLSERLAKQITKRQGIELIIHKKVME
jgi:hypothetical protein